MICLLTAEELFKLLSTTKEQDIRYSQHFLERVELRSDEIVPTRGEATKILINTYPTYVEYQSKHDRYKLYYNTTEKYDFAIVISLHPTSSKTVELITIFKLKARRRLNKNERNIQ
jgi:hypothetical protein